MTKYVRIELVNRRVGDVTQYAVSVNGRAPTAPSWFSTDGDVTVDNITQSTGGVHYHLKFSHGGVLQTVQKKFIPWEET